MTCTCPKCHAKIELDLPEVAEAGTSAVCPACNARFTIHKESFGGRALRKSSEISCAPCGGELGAQTHCPSCGAQFPDILVASTGRKRVRRESKKVKLKTSPFPHAQKSTTQLPTLEMSMKPEALALPRAKTAASKYPKSAVLAVTLLVVIALAAAGSTFYLKHKAEQDYAKNFVRATYCVQVGFDKALKTSARMSSEWKGKADSGQSFTPHPGMDDDKAFALVDSKLDQSLRKITKAPEKFAGCGDRLAKLQAVYNKQRSLILAPGNSWQAFAEITAKQDAEYKKAVTEYKAGMPVEIMEELTSASLKFRDLRPLLQ